MTARASWIRPPAVARGCLALTAAGARLLAERVTLAVVVALVVGLSPRGAALANPAGVEAHVRIGETSYGSLAEALSAAEDGDTVTVKGGQHPGTLVIDKAIELVGTEQPVIDGGGVGTVVTLDAPGIRFTGFEVRGSGSVSYEEDAGIRANATAHIEDNVLEDVLYGINLKAAPASVVRNNRVIGRDIFVARRGDGIRAWESANTLIEGNVVEGSRDVVIWYSQSMSIRNNTVRDGRYGLHFMYSHDTRIEGNRLEGNSVGAFLMYSTGLVLAGNVIAGNHGPSGYGVALKDCDNVALTGNILAGNRVGLYFDNSPSKRDVFNRIEENTIAYNDIGVAFQPSVRRNVLLGNSFTENFQNVAVLGTGRFEGNVWTDEKAETGNYWSNYAGFDWDADGVGDLAHREEGLFDDLLESHPNLRLYRLSPAQSAVDFASRAFPVFRPPPVLTDSAPLMAPAGAASDSSAAPPARAGIGVGLVGLASAVLVWGMRFDRGSTTRMTTRETEAA